MKNKEMIIEKDLELVDYIVMVNALAEEFFDENGEYLPYAGKLNAMRLFYNNCVRVSDLDEQVDHNITNVFDMEKLITNEEFIKAFNDTISKNDLIRFDFGNAYNDALDIVNHRKSSIGGLLSSIGKMISNITNSMTDENIEKISKIAQDITDGVISPESIVDAYGNSKRFSEVVNSDSDKLQN